MHALQISMHVLPTPDTYQLRTSAAIISQATAAAMGAIRAVVITPKWPAVNTSARPRGSSMPLMDRSALRVARCTRPVLDDHAICFGGDFISFEQ